MHRAGCYGIRGTLQCISSKCAILLLLIFSFLIFPIYTIRAFELESIAWRKLDSDQGFTGGAVSSLLQDRRGFIWIGASGGLYRFDGVQFKRINPILDEDPYLPAENFSAITCLIEDSRGLIWVGSKGMGLAVYDQIGGRLFKITLTGAPGDVAQSAPEREKHRGVEALAADRGSNIFVAWSNGGVSKITLSAEGVSPKAEASRSELLAQEDESKTSTKSGGL